MTIRYGGGRCEVLWGRYAGVGRAAVALRDAATGEPVATLTVNLPDLDHLLGDREVFLNHDCVTLGRLPDVLACGLFEATGRSARAGYAEFVILRLVADPPKTADDDRREVTP